ncbi:MAG: two pore domain potassium channel family protein [Phycisphaerae bacterium]|nr:two pore domain potassium channel family protein [Phycisphaerae bacterium]MBN8596716.1 two pore domain potassium channel family protein [Planctomycetota bacterium]
MFEHKSEPLLSRAEFLKRQCWHALIGIAIVAASLAIGTFGYHYLDRQNWIDAAYSATMILTAMGPSGTPNTDGGKVFGIFYALFSGIAFITTVTVLLTPLAHRFLHRLHADEADLNAKIKKEK